VSTFLRDSARVEFNPILSIQFNGKYQKNKKKQKAPRQEIKEATKKAKRDKVGL